MSTLIPEIELEDLQGLAAADIKRLQCCEVYSDGAYICTLTIPGTDYIRAMTENNGQLSNSVAGENPEQVIREATIAVPSLGTQKDGIIETVTAGEPKVKRKYKRHKHRIKIAK